jgi:hypothetical protein
VHRQVLLHIFSGGIRFIFAKTIAPTTYLGNWVLMLVIISNSLLDLCPFLLEVIGTSNSCLLRFQDALEVVLGDSSLDCINMFALFE